MTGLNIFGLVLGICAVVIQTPIVIYHTGMIIGEFVDGCIEQKEGKVQVKKTRIELAKHVVGDESMYISFQRDLVEEYKPIF